MFPFLSLPLGILEPAVRIHTDFWLGFRGFFFFFFPLTTVELKEKQHKEIVKKRENRAPDGSEELKTDPEPKKRPFIYRMLRKMIFLLFDHKSNN